MENSLTAHELKHCEKCNGYKEIQPGWPQHEEDILPCLCDCESESREREERARKRPAKVDVA